MSTFIFAMFFICIVVLFGKVIFWGLKETWKTPGLGKDAFHKRDN